MVLITSHIFSNEKHCLNGIFIITKKENRQWGNRLIVRLTEFSSVLQDFILDVVCHEFQRDKILVE